MTPFYKFHLAWIALILSAGSSHAAQGGGLSGWTANLFGNSTSLQSCRALAAARGLSSALAHATTGSPQAFTAIKDNTALLASYPGDPEAFGPIIERIQAHSAQFIARRDRLVDISNLQKRVPELSGQLLEETQTVMSLLMQSDAKPSELSAASQLTMLSQRLGQSALDLSSLRGISPDAVFLLGKDVSSFDELSKGLLTGSPELNLRPAKRPEVRAALERLMTTFKETRRPISRALDNLKGFVEAIEVKSYLLADLQTLDPALARDCFPTEH